MKKELYEKAAELMTQIQAHEKDLNRLASVDDVEIIVRDRWHGDIACRPDPKLKSKICGLIYEETKERMVELQDEFDALGEEA